MKTKLHRKTPFFLLSFHGHLTKRTYHYPEKKKKITIRNNNIFLEMNYSEISRKLLFLKWNYIKFIKTEETIF